MILRANRGLADSRDLLAGNPATLGRDGEDRVTDASEGESESTWARPARRKMVQWGIAHRSIWRLVTERSPECGRLLILIKLDLPRPHQNRGERLPSRRIALTILQPQKAIRQCGCARLRSRQMLCQHLS